MIKDTTWYKEKLELIEKTYGKDTPVVFRSREPEGQILINRINDGGRGQFIVEVK